MGYLAANDKAIGITLAGSDILNWAELLNIFSLGSKCVRLVVKHVQHMKCIGSSFRMTMPVLGHSSSFTQRRITDVPNNTCLVFQAVNFV